MKNSEWISEVKRVGKCLGLDADQTHELTMWSIHMVYDKLEKAQMCFEEKGF